MNNNKVFFVNRSEIEGRLDPIMVLYNQRLKSYSHHFEQVKKFLLTQPQYGAGESGILRNNATQMRYIRITDIDEYGNLIDEMGVSADIYPLEQNKYLLKHNDILLARSGATVGKCYIHKSNEVAYPCVFAGYLIRLRFNENQILPDYFFIITQLNIYKEWVRAIQRVTAQPNINADEYMSFPLPIIPIEKQNEIVRFYNEKRKEYKNKLTQSQTLLNSISDYLLEKLGITVPKVDNSLNSRIFFINANDIRGGRLDPYFHNPQLKLSDFKAGFMLLGNAFTSCSGTIFSDENVNKSGIHNQNDIAILRANNIDLRTNSLDFSDVKYLNSDFSINPEHKLLKNDILVCGASGSKNHVGKVAFIKEDLDYYFGGFMFVLRSKTNVFSPEFVFEILASDYFRTFLSKVSGGTNINNLNLNMIKNFKIPLPDIETQKTIVAHIKQIREQAQNLEQQAKDLLQQTQQEIEKMILGN